MPEKAALTGARQKPSEVWLDDGVVAVRSLLDSLTGVRGNRRCDEKIGTPCSGTDILILSALV